MLSCAKINQFELSPRSLASRRFPVEKINVVLNEETDELMEYRQVMKFPKYRKLYTKSYRQELGQIDQRIPGVVNGINTIFFINKTDVPAERWKDEIYGRVVVNYRPEKGDPYCTRVNLIVYPGDCGTPTVDLLIVKLLLNIVISTPDAKFMTIDIKDFYLNTPMDRFGYMKLKLSELPKDFVTLYNLASKVEENGFVYLKIRRGMYGLPQSGILAQQLLEKQLNNKGYSQENFVPGLWTHSWRPITFTLCVGDFGVK